MACAVRPAVSSACPAGPRWGNTPASQLPALLAAADLTAYLPDGDAPVTGLVWAMAAARPIVAGWYRQINGCSALTAIIHLISHITVALQFRSRKM